MRGASLVLGLAATLALAACATPRADECHVEIEGPEDLRVESGDVRASYRVQGRAGSAAKVWLAAKRVEGDYVSGSALPVGPGPFKAVVELRLTGRVPEYLAVLEVAGRRCVDRVKP
jgi:hypothetical protein